MCTSIAMNTCSFYFGRSMDIDRSFGENVVILPRNYPLHFRHAGTLKHHYAMIGMAALANDYPLYAEAANEKGLCIAGLNFPGNAYYHEDEVKERFNIPVFELIPWILGKCSCVDDAKKLLEKTVITAEPFSKEIQPAELHWHIADKNSSIVLEAMRDGMHIYDDPANVLTNNPPFYFHMENLSQYINLTVDLPESSLCRRTGIKPFGKGVGSFGLPGDFSPASRFVKTAYLLANSVCGDSENESVSQFFHILDAAAVVNGSIEPDGGRQYFTTYSSCINAEKGIYYYKTYYNSQITAINMSNAEIDGEDLIKFPIITKQQINFEN